MKTIEIKNLNLKQIADSGQTFRFKLIDETPKSITYGITAFGKYLELCQLGNTFSSTCSQEDWDQTWQSYFDLQTDYQKIGQLILNSGDSYLKECYEYGQGVRILRQDLWEMLVSFIISQNNNIKRIAGSIEKLCQRYGTPIAPEKDIYAFPTPYQIDSAEFFDTSLGLGYRSEYLKNIFEYIKENPDYLSKLKTMDYEKSMESLLSLKGVGPKVANCICLFGLHHVSAFPIDTHVKQILSAHYPNGFDFNAYEGVAGILQQYMFYHKLTAGRK